MRGDTRGGAPSPEPGARRTGRTSPRTSSAGGGAKPARPPRACAAGCPVASPSREAAGGGIQGRAPAGCPLRAARRAMLGLRSRLTGALAARAWPPQVPGAWTPPGGRGRDVRDPRMRPPGSAPRPGRACVHRHPSLQPARCCPRAPAARGQGLLAQAGWGKGRLTAARTDSDRVNHTLCFVCSQRSADFCPIL